MININKFIYGCTTSLSIRHGLIWSNGGLVITRLNKVSEEILYLARKDFTSHCVRVKPLIHQGRIISEEGVRQGRGGLETRCDVLIWGLWERQTDAIINIIFGDTDTGTYKHEPTEKILFWWDNQKKDNHNKKFH